MSANELLTGLAELGAGATASLAHLRSRLSSADGRLCVTLTDDDLDALLSCFDPYSDDVPAGASGVAHGAAEVVESVADFTDRGAKAQLDFRGAECVVRPV